MVPALRHGTARTEHLDGVPWAGGFSFDAYGIVVGLRTSDGSLLGALRSAAPPGALSTDAPIVDTLYSVVVEHEKRERFSFYEDTSYAARGTNLDELLLELRSRMHFQVALLARTRLFVHAGVVGWRGGAILIPGRTHTGKSSLVAALVRAGATYYSDEYAVLDDAGLVHPFARPLGIRNADGRSRAVDPASLGAVGVEPLPVRLVIATHHVRGARWRPEPMSPGERVLALLDNTLAALHRPADALRILGAAATRAVGIRGPRGDAARIASRILAACPILQPEEAAWNVHRLPIRKHARRAFSPSVLAMRR